MAKPLRVVHWNAQSLTGKRRLLANFLREQEVDLMLISETHLSSQDDFRIPGYEVYRQDEVGIDGRAYRGLAVIARRRLVHQLVPPRILDSIYALGVDVQMGPCELRLFAVYRPPGYDFQPAEVRELLNSPLPTILAGDFNASHTAWGSPRTQRVGRMLYNDAIVHNYDIAGPDEPTRYAPNDRCADNVLDIVVSKGLRTPPVQQVLPDLPSDHRPVLLVLQDPPVRVAFPVPRRRINWEAYSSALEVSTQARPVETPDDVNRATEDLTSCLQNALTTASHTVPTSERRDPLPRRIKDLISEKRHLRRRWTQTKCPTLKTQLNRLTDRVKTELAGHAAETWEEHIRTVGDEIPSIHRLCRQLSVTPQPVRPLVDASGHPRYKAEDRAEIFAECLERQFTPNPTTKVEHVAAVELHLREYFSAQQGAEVAACFLSPGQVQRVIKKTKPKKVPGVDNISNMALRHMPPRTVAMVTRLFNGILRSGHFPPGWKLGRVIMLPKPGKNVRLPESYRPITLLCTLSKVFEKLLLQKLVPHIKPRPEQFGFRPEHSTTLQLTRVLHHMAAAMNKKEYTVAIMLDMEKAFDRVWHEGLLYKLSLSPAPRQLVRVVASFLQDRKFRVAVEDATSSERCIAAGVPQGSCLSPALYAHYTDDIPVVGNVQLALFADDAAYLSTSFKPNHAAAKLQPTLDALPDWLADWRMSVNVGKTQALITGSTMLPPPLQLHGQAVEWKPKVKYLGVTIDRRLTMAAHVQNVVGQVKSARQKLRPVLQSSLPLRAKLGIYKTYIRSRLTYAAPAWYALTAECHRKRLRAQEHACLRTITNAGRYVRNATIVRDLQLESLDTFVARLAKKMLYRADNSVHPMLRSIAPLHARPPDGRRRNLPRDLIKSSSSSQSEEE